LDALPLSVVLQVLRLDLIGAVPVAERATREANGLIFAVLELSRERVGHRCRALNVSLVELKWRDGTARALVSAKYCRAAILNGYRVGLPGGRLHGCAKPGPLSGNAVYRPETWVSSLEPGMAYVVPGAAWRYNLSR